MGFASSWRALAKRIGVSLAGSVLRNRLASWQPARIGRWHWHRPAQVYGSAVRTNPLARGTLRVLVGWLICKRERACGPERFEVG